ncbi:putative addiction module antidote protein,CopG/Arc/MetJ family [Methylobacterium aquaticum]|uniref:Putative addiction module antidote protein,CopG/Arc/MetJ family n=1 Tax=Methylobacterium aquaticum TaxID=270351 RepID=A0A0C6FFM1_9HYPH|nr:putative addiction module antidote protein,CopG/Arc/MetJ family [Methylobacterium aquaticum]
MWNGGASVRRSKPVTVTLGEMQEKVEARVRSGAYTSVSEVVRAGLRALDREEAALDAMLRQKVQEALNDPSPPIPADRVFEELRAYHAERLKTVGRDT